MKIVGEGETQKKKKQKTNKNRKKAIGNRSYSERGES